MPRRFGNGDVYWGEIGQRTRLPRVTLMILFGVAVGPVGFDLLPAAVHL